MLLTFTGYKYTTEVEANNARISCNQFYGIPKSEEDTTQNWVDFSYASDDSPPFWYIRWDDTLTPVLGQPITFDVTFPDNPSPI